MIRAERFIAGWVLELCGREGRLSERPTNQNTVDWRICEALAFVSTADPRRQHLQFGLGDEPFRHDCKGIIAIAEVGAR